MAEIAPKVASISTLSNPSHDTDLSEDHYRRLEALKLAPRQFITCFTVRRIRLLQWIWKWIDASKLHARWTRDSEGLEHVLAAGEELFALRKQKKTHAEISRVAADYIIHQRGGYRDRYVKYYVGHVLWSYYERYPKTVPLITKNRDPLKCAIESMLILSDSTLAKVIPEASAFIPVVQGGVEDDFGNWRNGVLAFLCRRVLHLEQANSKQEVPYAIEIRKALAKHVGLFEKRDLYDEALKCSASIYGSYHYITWELTELLGEFYLAEASEYILKYYFPQFRGDKIKAVRNLYENFLEGAQNSKDDHSELLREEVVPALSEFYMKNGDDHKARILLWSWNEEDALQVYNDNWVPFKGTRRGGRRVRSINVAQGLSIFADFLYSNLELSIFPFKKVTLTAVTPSEKEKKIRWHPVWEKLPIGRTGDCMLWQGGLEGGYEPKILREEDKSLVLEVPYLTYRCFESSKSYTYESYRKGSLEQPALVEWRSKYHDGHDFGVYFDFPPYSRQFSSSDSISSIGGLVVDEAGDIQRYIYDKGTKSLKVPREELPNLTESRVLKRMNFGEEVTIPGLFNNTPGDIAILDSSGVAGGYNLVSIDWVDWTRFILHKCSPGSKPEIVSSDGTLLPIVGYIYGSWVESALGRKWTGLQLFVVRAQFDTSGISDTGNHSCYFVLNPDELSDYREHQLLAEETRAICSFLNPSLYRVMNFSTLEPYIQTCFGSARSDFEGVTIDGPISNSDLPTELSRRDKWDNKFVELYYWNLPTDYNLMHQQITTEVKKRNEWDSRYSKYAKNWIRLHRDA
ncbi:hypothetical protein F5884DRAFT_703318 [Xylogone sp. PMI_703]|nr:hypothetical protein F5884DRAFT_703318 [Xylogone sp. PMI_703]